MNHMTDVGIKGLDLYCWEENGQWRFVNSARPNGKTNQATVIANMQPKEREYMLYLPLYDGLVSLSIGVDSLSSIDQPQINYPVREKPIVFYEPASCKEAALHVLEWHIPILYQEG